MKTLASLVLHFPRGFSTIKSARMAVDITGMRKPYHDKSTIFDIPHLVSKEPFAQFKAWFDEATNHDDIYEANAMHLATATKDGIPSGRVLLLKKFGPEGFTFFTNYGGRKAKELDSNPVAALTFYWEPLKKQVRVEGTVKRISEKESDEYFHSRPLSSQIAACASNQSQVIASREVLVEKEAELEEKYGGGEVRVPRPDWGGYVVVPSSVEFWQGQSTRMHDRIRFCRRTGGEEEEGTMQGVDGWVIERLSP